MSEIRHGGTNLLTIIEQAGDPAAVANKDRLYAKDVGGVTQFFMRESNGSVFPVGNLKATRVVIVDPAGTIATITAGLAAAAALTPTAAAPVLVWVAPATYTEAAGITIPLGVTLASMGRSPESAVIVASVTGAVVTLSNLSTIDGFTIEGAAIAGTNARHFLEIGTNNG